MKELENKIFNALRNIDISGLNISDEPQFEEYIIKELDVLLKGHKDILLNRQIEFIEGDRKLKPDIVIGWNEILIELKFDLKSLNDIYRLFYQAKKYSKHTKRLLILLVYDPNSFLLNEDIEDLEKIDKVKVIRID